MRNLFGALAVYDDHQAEVVEFVNILQELTFKREGLALLIRDEC